MLNYFLYRLGQYIALRLPLKLSYALAVFFCDVRYLFARADKRNAIANLKVIFPEKSNREIKKIRFLMFRNFAKYLVDFFRFSILDKAYISKYIKVQQAHYLDEALAQGNGVIILTAHLGNWELGGVVAAQLGYPFWAVALPHVHKKVDLFFNSQREQKGVHVIPFTKAVRMCLQVLKENKCLALLGDRDFTKEGGIEVDFFGKKTSLPKGPAGLSLITAAPIVPGFMVRNADDTFTLSFEKPIIPFPIKDKIAPTQEQITRLTLTFKDVMEDYIRRYPDQWYLFRKFWVKPLEEA